MRRLIVVGMAAATLFSAAPAFAQANPGRSAAEHMADMRSGNRDQNSRELSEYDRLTQKEQAKFVAKYRAETESFRANALQVAEQAKAPGVELPADAAARIRAALEADMMMWKNSFHLDKKEWKAWHDQWLVDVNALDAKQWAAQRANWFAARDAWIDKLVPNER